MASIPLLDHPEESHNVGTRSSIARKSESRASFSSATTSVASEILDNLIPSKQYQDEPARSYSDKLSSQDFQGLDLEDNSYRTVKGVNPRWKWWCWTLGLLCTAGWMVTLALFILNGSYKHRSQHAHDPTATSSIGAGKRITIDQIQGGLWMAQKQGISWIEGPNGEDGMLLEKSAGVGDSDFLAVEDIRRRSNGPGGADTITLMKERQFQTQQGVVWADEVWPSPDLKTVLVLSEKKSNWRHSYTGKYWLFDVQSQTGEPLDPSMPDGRIQLATWSPRSSAVAFTRNNNIFLRDLDAAAGSFKVKQITEDGGAQVFNGVPDWVYEEEVIEGRSTTWWSEDGKYIAFLSMNDTKVPEFPVQYFFSRPSGTKAKPGLENYPEVRRIKYPKSGTPNPTVHVRFYDVEKGDLFNVPITGDFPDDDRIITEVVWAGRTGKVLVRESNRESYILKMILIDVTRRAGKTVREENFKDLDGGWMEITKTTTFVPSDPGNGRPHDGYIDTIIHEGYSHLGYFTPLDSTTPRPMTQGPWEVENAPSAIDLANNFVYFVGTKESPIQRHIYKVKLDGTGLESVSNTKDLGYYSASFSKKASYALLSYDGPDIPWQKVISTPTAKEHYEQTIEENKRLAQMAAEHELPIKIYSSINVDGYELNVLERRPPHFDPTKKYPVLFFQYSGPGSQQVNRKFTVDFQSYVAATLGYIVVTVDGRGTGLMGRATRCIIHGNLGYYEATDQIETARIWGQREYVDESRMAIWGWSYGGYMTLKTLELDAGRTFRYGMAVAPVTDWEYYDSIYTERWMFTPQNNPSGYQNASVSNVTALSQNVRFLVMHGTADDNVHMQNTLSLLDQLDQQQVENYDVHVFPDSDHSIYFHRANRIVYDKLSWWITNAFNGEWEKIEHVTPLREGVTLGSGE